MALDVRVLSVRDRAGLVAVHELHRRIWQVDPADGLAVHVLQAVITSGGVVLVADVDGTPGGFLLGLCATDTHSADRFLYVHNLGVLESVSSLGVGSALMERAAQLANQHGLGSLRLMFDPLDLRNAHLYLTKLGGSVLAFYRDYWGEMKDAINIDRASDRLLVEIPASARSRSRSSSLGGDQQIRGDELAALVTLGVAQWDSPAGRWTAVSIPNFTALQQSSSDDASARLERFRLGIEGVLSHKALFAGVIADGLPAPAYVFCDSS